ncbi:MAG: hypothetical protein R3B39_00030 [Candidatus Paceibacterota bacterium]
MINDIIRIHKKLGETPLEALERVRLENPEYSNLPMTYAGRLDPMAEGELVVLIGEACKKKDEYLNMDKEYEFKILFGFKTDSYDLLGIPKEESASIENIKENLEKDLQKFKGVRTQEYPPFSSKTIDGVPLFQKTKNGEVFDLPTRQVEIYDLKILGFEEISGEKLLSEIRERISLVKGDFRQEEVLESWKNILSQKEGENFLLARVSMSCSSGTYVRSLVNSLSFPATTFSIKRTRIFKK